MPIDQARQVLIEAVDVRQSAAQDDHVWVDDIYDHREAACQTVFKAHHGCRGVGIAGLGFGCNIRG